MRESQLARKPLNLSFTEAATVPISAGTALRALVDVGRVQAGQAVLVIGASGGVGTYAVQLAKAFGADVTGVCSTQKQTSLAPSGQTTSSPTPVRTSLLNPGVTTWCSTSPATRH